MIDSKIVSILKEAERIAILPHISADGDALGSSFALGQALQKINKQVTIYLEEDIPYVYSFLPGKHLVEVMPDSDRNTQFNTSLLVQDETSSMKFDLVIALDTGDMGRLGRRDSFFRSAEITVNIDHHSTNTEFAKYNYVNASSSAVGEIIYDIIKIMDININTDIAECLYVAIATDTGGFRFSNTTNYTHKVAAALVEKGVNVAEISRRVFETVSFEKVKLIGLAIDTIELFEDGKIAFITVTDEMMEKSGAKDEDCDGIVNIGRNIKGVETAVMLREWNNNQVKVNLRSNNYVDVSEIANLHSGGGHKRAAGCIMQGNIISVKQQLLNNISKAIKKR